MAKYRTRTQLTILAYFREPLEANYLYFYGKLNSFRVINLHEGHSRKSNIPPRTTPTVHFVLERFWKSRDAVETRLRQEQQLRDNKLKIFIRANLDISNVFQSWFDVLNIERDSINICFQLAKRIVIAGLHTL